MPVKWNSNDFGGILLECGSGYIAVNGGAPLAELEKFYLPEGKPPAMMIATCKHYHRSWNVDRFCLKHHVPLVMAELAAQQINTEGAGSAELHCLSFSGRRAARLMNS